jgi:hypothetical protein
MFCFKIKGASIKQLNKTRVGKMKLTLCGLAVSQDISKALFSRYSPPPATLWLMHLRSKGDIVPTALGNTLS